MKLTQRTIEALALPTGRSEAIYFDEGDGSIAGLGIRVRDGGSRKWIFQYKLGAKQRRLTLGPAGALDLKEARKRAGALKVKVHDGHDPAAERAEGRMRAAETFGAVLPPFLDHQRGRLRPRSYSEAERHLQVQCRPLHGLPMARIDRRAIAGRLTAIKQGSGPVAANRARTSLSAFFNWALREGLADANPVIGTNVAEEVTSDRVLSAEELREIWLALPDSDWGAIVKLLMLTGQRRDEISSLRWSEVDGERIRFPKERVKNGREHVVAMSGAVRAIVAGQARRAGRDPVFGEGKGGFSGWGAAKAKLERDIAASRQARGLKPMAEWRLHDLRRTAATGMADLGVAPHVIEAVLNHVSGHKAGVAGIYNRSTYEPERAAALALWAEHVTQIVTGRAAKVVPLRRA